MLSDKIESVARAVDLLAGAGPLDPMLQQQIARTLHSLVREAVAMENAVVPLAARVHPDALTGNVVPLRRAGAPVIQAPYDGGAA